MGSVNLQVHVVLRGEIDMSVASELAAVFEAAAIYPVRVDAVAVTFVDSTALGIIARAYGVAESHRLPFEVVLSEAAARVFRVAGLDEHIPYSVAD